MFKKIILSLTLALSTLSFAQTLEQGKAHLRNAMKSKGLDTILRSTLEELSQPEYFTVVKKYISFTEEKKYFKSTIATDPSSLTQGQKKPIQNTYIDLAKNIAETLTDSEIKLLRNYLNKSDQENYYNDDTILDYLVKLKSYYTPLYKQLSTNTTTYNLTPCYPYSEKQKVQGIDCNAKYGNDDDIKLSLESSTEELFYALSMITFMTSISGCTKYLIEETDAQKEAYKAFLTRIGRETRAIPYADTSGANMYSISDIYNLDFFNHADPTKELLTNCTTTLEIIESLDL